jgi:hypothetical protein
LVGVGVAAEERVVGEDGGGESEEVVFHGEFRLGGFGRGG